MQARASNVNDGACRRYAHLRRMKEIKKRRADVAEEGIQATHYLPVVSAIKSYCSSQQKKVAGRACDLRAIAIAPAPKSSHKRTSRDDVAKVRKQRTSIIIRSWCALSRNGGARIECK